MGGQKYYCMLSAGSELVADASLRFFLRVYPLLGHQIGSQYTVNSQGTQKPCSEGQRTAYAQREGQRLEHWTSQGAETAGKRAEKATFVFFCGS